MEKFPQILFLLLLAGTAMVVGYFSGVGSYEKGLLFNLFFVSAAILYHLLVDKTWSRFYLSVLFFFLLSAGLDFISHYMEMEYGSFVYPIQLATCIGFLLILVEIIKETRPGTVLNRYGLLVFLVILADAFVISKIVELLFTYHLSLEHLFFGFIFTIIKLVLLSAGIISYLISTRKSRKVSFLNGALAAFLASDLIDTFNYLFFVNDPIPAAAFFQSGLTMVGFLLFYVYCTYPSSGPVVDANRL